MQKIKESWNLFFIYSSFIAFVAIFILGGMLLSPSEPGNALFLGLSFPRLLLASGLGLAFAFFAFLSMKALRDRPWAERTSEQWFGKSHISKGIIGLAAIGFGLGWNFGHFIADQRFDYRPSLSGDLIRPTNGVAASDASLSTWSVQARVGVEF